MFGGFEQAKDEKARKRWFASAGTSLIVYAIVGVGLLVLARQTVAKPKEEPPIDVSFKAAPDVPEVKTEAPPPPPPPTNRPRVKRPGKAAPTSPQKIPDARPDEGNPTGEIGTGVAEEYGDGDGEVGDPSPPPVRSPNDAVASATGASPASIHWMPASSRGRTSAMRGRNSAP